MNCKDVTDKIPQIIRHEIRSHQRIQLVDHIKNCTACRAEYHKYLNIFYRVDYNIVLPESEIEHNLIDLPFGNIKTAHLPKYIWPVAASLLILLGSIFIINRLQDTPEAGIISQERTVTQKLADEEWQEIARMLQDDSFFNREADEKIPLQLLLAKLEILEKRGIYKFQIVSGGQDNTKRNMDVSLLIKRLRKFKKYKSEISIQEISDYLTLI